MRRRRLPNAEQRLNLSIEKEHDGARSRYTPINLNQ